MATTYHHGNLRAALVEAAIELLAEKGDAGLTLRAVGRRLEVSRSAAYHHFSSKDQLLEAVAAEGFRRLEERLAGIAGSASEASLHRFALEYVRFAVTHPTLFRTMHRGSFAAPDEASPMTQGIANHSEAWSRVAGSPQRGLVAWCTIYGLAVLWIDGPMKSRVADRTVAALVTTAVNGLR